MVVVFFFHLIGKMERSRLYNDGFSVAFSSIWRVPIRRSVCVWFSPLGGLFKLSQFGLMAPLKMQICGVYMMSGFK